MKRFTMRRPCDFHSHFRSPAQVGKRCFRHLVRANTGGYCFVIAEPNAYLNAKDPAHHIETADDLVDYRLLIEDELPDESPCEVLLLAKLTPKTTSQMIDEIADAGGIGLKLYPEGVTTGAQHGGVTNFFSDQLMNCLERARERNLILQIHPTKPHTYRLWEEFEFHDVLKRYVRELPGLRIFIEHVTDKRTVELVHKLRNAGHSNVFGTITGHHTKLTTDDVLGQVDHHCWPCAKDPYDLACLVQTATSGTPYFLSITDSAPWKYGKKHLVSCGCAGVYNPYDIAIPWLVTLFEKHNALDNIEAFTSGNGVKAYSLGQPHDNITLVRREWTVPERIDTGGGMITPFLHGQKLPWRIENS